MSQGLEKAIQDASRKFAELSVKENPKLVGQYFAGKGGSLSALVEWAVKASGGVVNPNLTGEWTVLELLELHRARLKARKEGR